jgi:general stress protein YciG
MLNENEQNKPPTSPENGPDHRTDETEQQRSARGTAAMDPDTRQEVARKGGIAVSKNRAHMAEIGRKGGQSVSKNREHMAQIGRKGGAASRGQRKTTTDSTPSETPGSSRTSTKPGENGGETSGTL